MSDKEPQELIQTKNWLEQMVIGLNLCPFAKKPFVQNKIRFVMGSLSDGQSFTEVFSKEIDVLQKDDDIETTLLVIPDLDTDFYRFLDIIDDCNDFLDENGWAGVYQIAHFHPEYLFAEEPLNSPGHYTNRAPHAILHLLREQSMSDVLDRFDEPETIPENNIKTMHDLGLDALKAMLETLKSG